MLPTRAWRKSDADLLLDTAASHTYVVANDEIIAALRLEFRVKRHHSCATGPTTKALIWITLVPHSSTDMAKCGSYQLSLERIGAVARTGARLVAGVTTLVGLACFVVYPIVIAWLIAQSFLAVLAALFTNTLNQGPVGTHTGTSSVFSLPFCWYQQFSFCSQTVAAISSPILFYQKRRDLRTRAPGLLSIGETVKALNPSVATSF